MTAEEILKRGGIVVVREDEGWKEDREIKELPSFSALAISDDLSSSDFHLRPSVLKYEGENSSI